MTSKAVLPLLEFKLEFNWSEGLTHIVVGAVDHEAAVIFGHVITGVPYGSGEFNGRPFCTAEQINCV